MTVRAPLPLGDGEFIQLADFLISQEFLNGGRAEPGFTGVLYTSPGGVELWIDASTIEKVKYQPFIFTHPSGNKFPAYRTTIFTTNPVHQRVVLLSCPK